MEVDGVLIEMFEERGRKLRELGFGVTIRSRWIAIDRAKVSLPKDQRISHAPGLSQPHERVINGQVSMRVIFAHHLTDDPCTLARGPVRLKAHLSHRV